MNADTKLDPAPAGEAAIEAALADPIVFAQAVQPWQHADLDSIMVEVAKFVTPAESESITTGRRRGTKLVLNYLESIPANTWQERWDNSPLAEGTAAGFRETICEWGALPPKANRLWMLTQGLSAVLATGVVRPSFEVVFTSRLNSCWKHILHWRGDPNANLVDRVPATATTRGSASGIVARLAILTGRPVAELTETDLLTYRRGVLLTDTQTVGLGHLWLCLADANIVAGSLHQALRPGPKTPSHIPRSSKSAPTKKWQISLSTWCSLKRKRSGVSL